MLLDARLYLREQVYIHRTVRPMALQLREVSRPTVELVLGGNPLERLDDYLMFTEWALLTEVNRWALGEGDAPRRELGQAWADVGARKPKWRLIYQGHTGAAALTRASLRLPPAQFPAMLRERLPA